jgi:uncharacterized membrane protein
MGILFGLTLVLVLAFVAMVLPILSWARAARAMSEMTQLRARLSALEQHVRDLGHATASSAAPASRSPTPAATPDEVVPLAGEPTTPPFVPPAAERVHPPVFAERVPLPDLPSGVPPSTVQPRTQSVGGVPTADTDEGWVEAAIGGRLLLYVGTVALVLGVGFFLKYAFDRNWITEWMRVSIGALSGIALIVGGLRLAGRGYSVYGQILEGGGLAVLYLSIYAAFGFYGLIGSTTAFTLFLLVTACAAFFSDRQQSQGMAIMAVGGGFLTPFMVGSGTDAQVTLFSYDAVLIAGTMYLARRRDWPLLNVVSFGLTVITVTAWGAEYYTPSKYLRTTLFLTLYCGMFLFILREMLRQPGVVPGMAAVALGAAPVLYHCTVIVLLFRHGVALLVYLIAFSLLGVAWAIRRYRPGARVALWAAALLPLLLWISQHQARTWMAPALVTVAAIFLLHLLAQLDRIVHRESSLTDFDVVLLHLNGLGAFGGVYLVLERNELAWIPTVGLVLVGIHAAIAWLVKGRDTTAALQALAVAFTLLAATIGVRLDGAWLTAAWAAEGAAIMWIGLAVRREWLRGGGAVLLLVSIWRWFVFLAPVTPLPFQPVLNGRFLVGAWIVGLLYLSAWLVRRASDRIRDSGFSLAGLLIAASVLSVVMITTDANAYWDLRGETSPDATFARELSVSVIWALYAGVLITIGFRRRYAPIRYLAIALLALTIGKVFLVDLSGLEGIYRVLGLVILGAVLLLVSFLYQRVTRAEPNPDAEPLTPPGS